MKKKSEMKICRACGDELPRSEFHRNRNMRDGLKAKCKNCRATSGRADRAKGVR